MTSIAISTVLYKISSAIPKNGSQECFHLRFCKMDGSIRNANVTLSIKDNDPMYRLIGNRKTGNILLNDIDNNSKISVKVAAIMEFNHVLVNH